MGEPKVIVVADVRAKTLPLGAGRSVYKLSHAQESASLASHCPANDSVDPASGQDISDARSEERAYACLLRNSLRADGLAIADAAAACNLSRQAAQDMCDPDGRGKTISLKYAVRIAKVSKTWRAAMVELFRGAQ